jgi:hypothetical protein
MYLWLDSVSGVNVVGGSSSVSDILSARLVSTPAGATTEINQTMIVPSDVPKLAPEPSSRFRGSDGDSDAPVTLLPVFYKISELDDVPYPVDALPEDLASISSENVAGRLVLQVWLDETGRVVKVEVEDSTLSEALGLAVAKRLAGIAFSPGKRRGVPVNTLFRFEVGSRLEDGSSLPSSEFVR